FSKNVLLLWKRAGISGRVSVLPPISVVSTSLPREVIVFPHHCCQAPSALPYRGAPTSASPAIPSNALDGTFYFLMKKRKHQRSARAYEAGIRRMPECQFLELADKNSRDDYCR